MSYSSLLIDTCIVRRYAEGVVDSYGNPTEMWADYLSGQACRLTVAPSGPGREVMVGAKLVVADYQLFTEDIDITEQDRVIVDGVTYEVLMVKPYKDSSVEHHKQSLLRTVR